MLEANESAERLKLQRDIASLAANTAQLNAAKARVETLWRGSQVDFGNQNFGSSKEEYDLIAQQLLGDLPEGHLQRKQLESAIDDWRQAAAQLSPILTSMLTQVEHSDKEGDAGS